MVSSAVRCVPGNPACTTDTPGTSKSVVQKEREKETINWFKEDHNGCIVFKGVSGPPSSTTDTLDTSKSVEQI